MMRLLFISWFALVPLSRALGTGTEDVLWVSDLETLSGSLGQEIVLEARFQGRVGAALDQIRLKNCNPDRFEFRLEPDPDRKPFPSSLQYIRLTGVLTRSGDKLVMRIKSWNKVTTTDEDRFRGVARDIGRTDHESWYELAARTQRLADFYGERELKRLANEARLQGFRAEEAALRRDQPAELLKLASRAADLELDAEESRRMRHKALRWNYDLLANSSAPAQQWFELADAIAQHLEGAKTPLTPADAALVAQYRQKPLDVYDTMPKARNKFDRASWVDATASALLAQSTQPGADLANLSVEATQRLPDRPELGAQLLRQWADREATRVTLPLPATQVRRLAETFRKELGDPKRAQEVLRHWLEARRHKLSAKDADGRVRLAKDFSTELKDDDSAAKLLMEALQIEPDLPEAAKQLTALGYVATPSGWKRASEAGLATVTRTSGSRLPEKNMTPDQVRTIMGDPRPADRIRFAYRREGRLHVTEQWTYLGPPNLYVTFEYDPTGSARVIAINTPTQK